MLEKAKDKFFSCIYCIVKILMYLPLSVYAIFRHPFKNLSIWLAIAIAIFLFFFTDIRFEGKYMLLRSLGLVSIMTFISNYLEKQTVDNNEQDNFYLGYNIKKLQFFRNFWFKQFGCMPLKLYFWIIAIIPVISIFFEVPYKNKNLQSLFDALPDWIIKILDPLWLAVFAVSAFYCTALLIESMNLSSKSFSQSYRLIDTTEGRKRIIKSEVREFFQREFNRIFNLKSQFGEDDMLRSNAKYTIEFIVHEANEVSKNDDEKGTFFNIAFDSEARKIRELKRNVYQYSESHTSYKLMSFIYNQRFVGTLKSLKEYYQEKWEILNRMDVLPLELVKLARTDLDTLHRIECTLHQNENYKSVFWGECPKSQYTANPLGEGESEREVNLPIAQIAEVLEGKFQQREFLNQINEIDAVMRVLKIFAGIDKRIEAAQYFPDLFELVFDHSINEAKDGSEFSGQFLERIKNPHLSNDLKEERTAVSKRILMEGFEVEEETLAYLLDSLNLEDLITVLIFRLAYAERSHRKEMNIKEFKVWKNAVHKSSRNTDIKNLQHSNFVNDLQDNLSESFVSHFITNKFIDWLWESLFTTFTEGKYEEFIELGRKNIRRDFNLKNYVVLRLLLAPYPYGSISTYDYQSKKNKEDVKDQLSDIKDILHFKSIYGLTSFG